MTALANAVAAGGLELAEMLPAFAAHQSPCSPSRRAPSCLKCACLPPACLCRSDGSIAGKAINHTVTLEGNRLEVDCMNGKKLQFVRAVYGATDRGFCPNEIVNGGLLT